MDDLAVKDASAAIDKIPPDLRKKDVFHHIDMGFLNRRLCLSALPSPIRDEFSARAKPGSDHFTQLGNDHLLVTMLLDVCDALEAPTLMEALAAGTPHSLFRSTAKLEPCPDLYSSSRVEHGVILDIDFGKPVVVAYHTSHLVSDTGRMTLRDGAVRGYVEAIVGVVHDRGERFEIEPLVMGAPWLDHPRNGADRSHLMWMGRHFGELKPEDIDQLSRLTEVTVSSADEWMSVMKTLPEKDVKTAFGALLKEPTKKDWGGETNDHFSGSVTVAGQSKTAAFVFKGPTHFREMTLDICGSRADQLLRMTKSGADISVVQHSHLIGEAVRETLRALTFYPGRPRKYCLIDGQSTYRILKAYGAV